MVNRGMPTFAITGQSDRKGMKTRKAAARLVGTVAMAAVLVGGATATANARSGSGIAKFDNGQVITANLWIQSFSTSCGAWKSSAVMKVSPRNITNQTAFYQNGFGTLSISGVSIESSRQNPNTLRWTNDKGQKGSYLSGSVCGGWGAVYVGADVQASAFYFGNFRIASAHV